jgi:hypothetical protein
MYFQIVEEINYMFRPFSGWTIIRLRLECCRKLIHYNVDIKNEGTRSRFTMFGDDATEDYTLSYITPLFDIRAPTYFGIHVPSSGSFLCPRELLESRNVCCLSCTVNVGGLCAPVVVVLCVMLSSCVHWLLWFRVLCCPAEHTTKNIHSTSQTT